MQIAIVGGHGKVALQLHPILVRLGHSPVALVRSEDYRSELEGLGAEVRLLDIENQGVDAFAAAFAGCDAVVFTAGGGPDGNKERKRTVDLEGSLKSQQAARTAGIRRFVQVSAINVDAAPDPDRGEVWTAYVQAKRDADAALRETELAWTILRPGSLTDSAGTGLITLGEDLRSGQISRTDVATVVAVALDNDATIGRQWDLVGGDTPIADAIEALTSSTS